VAAAARALLLCWQPCRKPRARRAAAAGPHRGPRPPRGIPIGIIAPAAGSEWR